MEGQQTSLGCLRVALICRISRDQIVETGKTSLEEENGNLDAGGVSGEKMEREEKGQRAGEVQEEGNPFLANVLGGAGDKEC